MSCNSEISSSEDQNMMPCTLNKRPNRITVLNESTKQILSNFTPINFYFTEFELVHYSLIDWLSMPGKLSIGWLNRFKETHCASWLRNWAFSVSRRLMPGIKMQCNAHLNKLHSRGFERNESICKQSDSVPNLA